MQLKIDRQWIGLVLGLIVPAITFFMIYLFAYPKHSLVSYYAMITAKNFFTQILSLAVIPNVMVFFVFIWTNKLLAARGVLGATILMAILVFALKIFG
jgi:hypothetical protein